MKLRITLHKVFEIDTSRWDPDFDGNILEEAGFERFSENKDEMHDAVKDGLENDLEMFLDLAEIDHHECEVEILDPKNITKEHEQKDS